MSTTKKYWMINCDMLYSTSLWNLDIQFLFHPTSGKGRIGSVNFNYINGGVCIQLRQLVLSGVLRRFAYDRIETGGSCQHPRNEHTTFQASRPALLWWACPPIFGSSQFSLRAYKSNAILYYCLSGWFGIPLCIVINCCVYVNLTCFKYKILRFNLGYQTFN